jgi:hypothetical protein
MLFGLAATSRALFLLSAHILTDERTQTHPNAYTRPTPPHTNPRYLFTEWEDPSFGGRASCVHAALVDALTGARRGEAVWEAIRRQTDMVSQLAYIVKDLKVG